MKARNWIVSWCTLYKYMRGFNWESGATYSFALCLTFVRLWVCIYMTNHTHSLITLIKVSTHFFFSPRWFDLIFSSNFGVHTHTPPTKGSIVCTSLDNWYLAKTVWLLCVYLWIRCVVIIASIIQTFSERRWRWRLECDFFIVPLGWIMWQHFWFLNHIHDWGYIYLTIAHAHIDVRILCCTHLYLV